MAKNRFSRADLGSWGGFLGVLGASLYWKVVSAMMVIITKLYPTCKTCSGLRFLGGWMSGAPFLLSQHLVTQNYDEQVKTNYDTLLKTHCFLSGKIIRNGTSLAILLPRWFLKDLHSDRSSTCRQVASPVGIFLGFERNLRHSHFQWMIEFTINLTERVIWSLTGKSLQFPGNQILRLTKIKRWNDLCFFLPEVVFSYLK